MTLPYIISGAILLVALAIWHVFRVTRNITQVF